MGKREQLDYLRAAMEKDKSLPLRESAKQLVFGEGNSGAAVYFLGEAPGRMEDELGKPFIGRAGKLLTELLESIGMKREDIYITSVVRYRPPNNRQPTPTEIAAFLPYVNEEISIICPKLIVTLGRFAMEKFLPKEKITKVHGKLSIVLWQGREISVLPLYHPAAALRSTRVKETLTQDFQKIPSVLANLQ